MAEKRDFWDKLEIGTKFFSGVVLASLVFMVGIGTQKVVDSIKYGELSQKLLQDLSLPDSSNKVRRDLSLIILNRTIGEDKEIMLADMAEVICQGDSTSLKGKEVAYGILYERDSTRALKLKNNSRRTELVIYASGELRKNVISTANALPEDLNPVPNLDTVAIQKIKDVSVGAPITTVFIQSNKNYGKLKDVKSTLEEMGFLVPNIERIGLKFRNTVRYFNNDDALTAAEIVKRITAIKSDWKCEILKMNNPGNLIRPGQIEVWIQ